MEYFILNEHSLPINDVSKIDSCLVQFFEVYKIATKRNFKHIRVSNNIDSAWYEISIGNHKTLRDWISEQSSDYSSRLKSLISSTQCPIYDQSQIEEEFRSELSEFRYEGQSVPNLGAVYLLKQLSFSFNSSNIWNYNTFQIIHEELTKHEEIVENQINIRNVTTTNHWENHYNLIEQLQIKAVSHSKEIIENLNIHFPNIGFTNSAVKQLNNNNFTSTLFSEIWVALKNLNLIIEDLESDFNCEVIIKWAVII